MGLPSWKNSRDVLTYKYAVAYEIEKSFLYNTPKELKDYGIKAAPQSYVYIKKGVELNEWK